MSDRDPEKESQKLFNAINAIIKDKNANLGELDFGSIKEAVENTNKLSLESVKALISKRAKDNNTPVNEKAIIRAVILLMNQELFKPEPKEPENGPQRRP